MFIELFYNLGPHLGIRKSFIYELHVQLFDGFPKYMYEVHLGIIGIILKTAIHYPGGLVSAISASKSLVHRCLDVSGYCHFYFP